MPLSPSFPPSLISSFPPSTIFFPEIISATLTLQVTRRTLSFAGNPSQLRQSQGLSIELGYGFGYQSQVSPSATETDQHTNSWSPMTIWEYRKRECGSSSLATQIVMQMQTTDTTSPTQSSPTNPRISPFQPSASIKEIHESTSHTIWTRPLHHTKALLSLPHNALHPHFLFCKHICV